MLASRRAIDGAAALGPDNQYRLRRGDALGWQRTRRLSRVEGSVIGLTRQIASELAELGITANAVAPGPVDTPMTKVLHSDEFRDAYTAAIPMKRYGAPEEIAALVSFLASESAGSITGAAIPVDGGFMAAGALG